MNFCRLEPTGECPPARTWHSTLVLRDQQSFCVYGGYNGKHALNDVFLFHSGNYIKMIVSIQYLLFIYALLFGIFC